MYANNSTISFPSGTNQYYIYAEVQHFEFIKSLQQVKVLLHFVCGYLKNAYDLLLLFPSNILEPPKHAVIYSKSENI